MCRCRFWNKFNFSSSVYQQLTRASFPYQDGNFFCTNMNCQAVFRQNYRIIWACEKKITAFTFIFISSLKMHKSHSGMCGSTVWDSAAYCIALLVRRETRERSWILSEYLNFPAFFFYPHEHYWSNSVSHGKCNCTTLLDEFYSHILGLLVPHNGSHNSHVKWRNDLPRRQLCRDASSLITIKVVFFSS